MKLFLFSLCSLALATLGHAQWQTTSYALKGGWNSIYLHGDASHATPEALFASSPEILEVWRWNPNPNQVQFISTPQAQSNGTPEWSTWIRGGTANTLAQMTGQTGYLIRCAGTAADSYSVPLVQRMLPPTATWVRNGANLMGFPSKLNGSYPTFSSYFSSFQAVIAADTKIFKYIGGDLSAQNPIQVFSPLMERLDRNQAYWFDAAIVGNFTAPAHLTFSSADGLNFGRTGSIITGRVFNRRDTPMTLTIAPVASDPAPTGQDAITANAPVTRRVFNPNTATWTESLITTAYNEVIPANSSIEVSFGIDRNAMSGGSVDAFYASMLRFTDAANQFDILIPATARKGTLAGLWIGEALVSAVESKAQADAITPTSRSYPLRYILHVADDGTARVLSQVFLGSLATAPHDLGLCTTEAGLKADTKANATRIVSVHMPLDKVLATGSGSVAAGDTLTRTISVPFDDPTNPFVHQYHPDHDNKDAKGNDLAAGFESYNIERQISFTFTSAPPAGSSVTVGWGSSVIGGTYSEVVQGLHKDTLGVGTGDGLHITGTFELRRASEIGTISITP